MDGSVRSGAVAGREQRRVFLFEAVELVARPCAVADCLGYFREKTAHEEVGAQRQYPRIGQICRGTVLVHGSEGIIPSGNTYAEESECSGIAEGQVPRTV